MIPKMIFHRILPFVFLVGLAAGARADELPRGSPEAVGFSSARLDYIQRAHQLMARSAGNSSVPGLMSLRLSK
jgi:hypothetical protein